jgi:hypothetical protein
MDIIDLLANDERIIVYSSKEDRSIVTWNQTDTLQWWRPVVRIEDPESYKQDNWEEVGILTQSGYGPKSYKQARKVAIAWLTDSL